MKIYEKIIAIIASMAVLSCSAVSCGEIEVTNTTNIEAVDPLDLEELPRGEYEVSVVEYLTEIENITDISPLDDNRFLVISEALKVGEPYGDASVQKLYVADDTNSSVTEITPDLKLGETAYYSALGTKDGKIFITAIEPEYRWGKDPGHDEEENNAYDRISFLFSKAKNVNYKLFEINTNGEVISENKLDIEYDPDSPVNWLICEDYWDDKLVISATVARDYFDKETTYYVANKSGEIEEKIKNHASPFRPEVKKVTSDGRFCFVEYGWDADDKPCESISIYGKVDFESYESFSFKSEDFGCDKKGIVITAGTSGHGDDLLYLSSAIGLFSFDKNGNYENIINYIDLLPDYIDIEAVAVLDNNNVLVLAKGLFAGYNGSKSLVYRFKNVSLAS